MLGFPFSHPKSTGAKPLSNTFGEKGSKDRSDKSGNTGSREIRGASSDPKSLQLFGDAPRTLSACEQTFRSATGQMPLVERAYDGKQGGRQGDHKGFKLLHFVPWHGLDGLVECVAQCGVLPCSHLHRFFRDCDVVEVQARGQTWIANLPACQ
jgi:hypothetical protein